MFMMMFTMMFMMMFTMMFTMMFMMMFTMITLSVNSVFLHVCEVLQIQVNWLLCCKYTVKRKVFLMC